MANRHEISGRQSSAPRSHRPAAGRDCAGSEGSDRSASLDCLPILQADFDKEGEWRLSVVWILVLAVIVGLFVARGLKAFLVAGAVVVVIVIAVVVYNTLINWRWQCRVDYHALRIPATI